VKYTAWFESTQAPSTSHARTSAQRTGKIASRLRSSFRRTLHTTRHEKSLHSTGFQPVLQQGCSPNRDTTGACDVLSGGEAQCVD